MTFWSTDPHLGRPSPFATTCSMLSSASRWAISSAVAIRRALFFTVGVYFSPWVPGSLGHSSRCSINIGDHGMSNWDVYFNHFSGDMAPWHLKITGGNRKTQCHPLVNQHIFPIYIKIAMNPGSIIYFQTHPYWLVEIGISTFGRHNPQ